MLNFHILRSKWRLFKGSNLVLDFSNAQFTTGKPRDRRRIRERSLFACRNEDELGHRQVAIVVWGYFETFISDRSMSTESPFHAVASFHTSRAMHFPSRECSFTVFHIPSLLQSDFKLLILRSKCLKLVSAIRVAFDGFCLCWNLETLFRAIQNRLDLLD
jgi:hypothetical protein